MKAIAAGGYPVVAERLPHGGIVHGKKMREREKMVKKRRNACAEGAEDTKERRKKKEEGKGAIGNDLADLGRSLLRPYGAKP